MSQKTISKIMALVSVLVCFLMLLSSTSVYAVSSIQPDSVGANAEVRFPFLIVPLRKETGFLSQTIKWLWIGADVEVLGYSNGYTYVKVINSGEKGYIFSFFLDDDTEGTLNITASFKHVYVGAEENLILNYNGAGNVSWSVSKSGIIEYTKTENGIKIEGLSPGTVTVTAKAGTHKDTCTVHCIYKWKKAWTGEATVKTEIRTGPGTEYGSREKVLPSGGKFHVTGDDGGSKGWAYGYYTSGDNKYWGFVPIKNISTKSTVSYYNNLGWGYPLYNEEYNYISSPFSPRPSMGDLHRGFDIATKSGQNNISGQKLIAPFDGIVKKISTDPDNNTGCGYYICITSEDIDPITGKNLIVTYQHMKSQALFSKGEEVERGEIVGYVGSTGRVTGPHLHFEVNSQNAAIGESGRSDFTYTINPIYFYMNRTFELNNGCSAVENGYGFYWYNYDK